MDEAKSTTVSVRVSDTQLAQIKELAKKYNVDRGDVVRWALEALEKYVAAHKGRVVLPLDFTEQWTLTRPHGEQPKGS